MKIETASDVLVARPIEAVFDFTAGEETFVKVLRPYGPIPGVDRVVMDDSGPMKEGSERSATMSDHSVLRERVVRLERPHAYHYRWLTRPALPFSLLVKTGFARWNFTSEGAGTRIHWTYEFELTSPVAYPFMLGVLYFFRRWMIAGLGRIQSSLAG